MEMVIGGSLATSKTLAEELKEGVKKSGQTQGAVAVSPTEKPAGTFVTASGDSVEISEEGRQQLAESWGAGKTSDASVTGTGENTLAAQMGAAGAEESETQNTAEETKEAVIKQIREVQKKLASAKERLAEAMAASGAASATAVEANAEPASSSSASGEGSEIPEQNDDGGMADALLGDSSMEVKAIQVEISNLNSQLLLLNKRLEELSKFGSNAGAPGGGTRAGINTPGTGEAGGKGQRMPIRA